ncbi:tyrosine-type recombinase/integrase [Gordonia amarae]|uniref:tyrosine-type recombinase/integrase n=1 Tax=Gordonia amarae TaxID=36821 RepID=UPI001AF51D60|nr:site-specific integrase [Gordonia amarae]QHN30774.1 tyrosine-type recombinase/integrase [Gordonia amarae]
MATVTSYQTTAGTRYEVRYRLPSGQTTRKRGFTTKRDATAYMHSTEVSKSTGGFVQTSAGRVTVATLAEAWKKSLDAKAAKTRRNRLSVYSHDVEPRWGTTPVGKIKRSHVEAWVSEMLGAGRSAVMIEGALGVLRQVLALGVADGNLAANPAADVSAPKRLHTARGYLSHAQVEELATEAGPRGHDLILFLSYTGLRIGEAAGLRARDVDLRRRRITVERAVTEADAKNPIKAPKTQARRTVPYPEFLDKILETRTRGKALDAPLFPAEEGGLLRASNWRHRTLAPAVERCVERTAKARAQEAADAEDGNPTTDEFPTVTTHDLRHTAASLAISAGANVKAVQRMLGHAKASMTLDTYADLFPDDLERVATKLSTQRAEELARVHSVSTKREEALPE